MIYNHIIYTFHAFIIYILIIGIQIQQQEERKERLQNRIDELTSMLEASSVFEPTKVSDGVHRKKAQEKFYPEWFGPPKKREGSVGDPKEVNQVVYEC